MRAHAKLLAVSVAAWPLWSDATQPDVVTVPEVQVTSEPISSLGFGLTGPDRINFVPDDPQFASQWGLHNTGQNGGTPGADIDAVRAWDLETGSPQVVIAILGTGIDFDHPELASHRWTNPGEIPGNGIDDDTNGFIDDVSGWDFVNNDADPDDDNGHGTFVAGIAAATGNNGIGVAGIAWDVQLIAVKCLSSIGSGTLANVILATDYATRIGATIILAGFGGGGFSQAHHDAIAAAGAAGIPFVADAGSGTVNIDNNPVYPGSYALANIVVATATTATDVRASFASWGPNTVDLGAPGVNIRTTTLNSGYVTVSGTSMASAHVAGGLALVASHFPGLRGDALIEHLLAHVDVLPALAGLVRTSGRLNVYLPLVEAPTDVSYDAGPGVKSLRAWWIPSQEGGRIGFTLPEPGEVRLAVFDVRGRRLWDEQLGTRSAGVHTWDWNGASVRVASTPSGVYFVRLQARGSTSTRVVLQAK